MITNNIYKHILLEFSKTRISGDAIKFLTEGKNILFEKHGIIPNIESYWKVFCDEISEKTPNKNGDYIINDNIFYDIENNPFGGVYIKVHHEEIEGTTVFVNGQYSPSVKNELDDGRIFLKMVFTIKCNKRFMLKGLKSLFMHELTHAYEDYFRLKNKRNGLSFITNNSNYKNLNKDITNEGSLESMIDNICYFLSPSESKAYVATLKGEMELGIKNCENSNDVFNLLKNTFTWDKLKTIESVINLLLNINEPHQQMKILTTWYAVTNENFKTYSSLKRILKGKYLKRCNHMMNQISKLVYDMYMENGIKNTIPSSLSFDIK